MIFIHFFKTNFLVSFNFQDFYKKLYKILCQEIENILLNIYFTIKPFVKNIFDKVFFENEPRDCIHNASFSL
jgi:hypothetical protein